METIPQLASTYSTFGVFACLAVLSVVVVYLYRKTETLYKDLVEMKTTSFEDSKKSAVECAQIAKDASNAIVNCTNALQKMNDSLSALREEVTELRTRI